MTHIGYITITQICSIIHSSAHRDAYVIVNFENYTVHNLIISSNFKKVNENYVRALFYKKDIVRRLSH